MCPRLDYTKNSTNKVFQNIFFLNCFPMMLWKQVYEYAGKMLGSTIWSTAIHPFINVQPYIFFCLKIRSINLPLENVFFSWVNT